MERQDNLSEQDHVNIAIYHQKTLWNEAITKDYLTPRQVAELYHVSESAVYRWIKQGWIEADRVHGKNAKVARYRISPLLLDQVNASCGHAGVNLLSSSFTTSFYQCAFSGSLYYSQAVQLRTMLNEERDILSCIETPVTSSIPQTVYFQMKYGTEW